MIPPVSSPLSRFLLAGGMLFLSGVLGAQLFEDDFEAYPVGTWAAWSPSSGGTVVDETSSPFFGSPNRSVRFLEAGDRLMQDVQAVVPGQVTTLSVDFVEPSAGIPGSGLQVGFGLSNEINTGNGAIRVQLENGIISHNTLGGLSTVTQSGISGFEKDVVHRLFIVVNDSASALTDYEGTEDLAPGRFEVWLYSAAAGLRQVVEATLAREPRYAGFRTWSSYDALFYIDNFRLDAGVFLEATSPAGCALISDSDTVVSGVPFTLRYTVFTELPAGSVFKLGADSGAAFSNGGTGPAGASGEVQVVLTADNLERVALSLVIEDSAGNFICGASTFVRVYNYNNPSAMVHPSIISTQAQLEQMRNLVNHYPGSVARAGWEAMLRTPYASKNYVHTPQEIVLVVPSGGNASEAAFRSDCTAARCHALQWVVTGDPGHRDIALRILNDWGHAFRDMQSTGSFSQTYLESAWALPVWLSAADILRYYNNGEAGWDPLDMAAFNRFMEILYERATAALDRNNNWGASAAFAVMAYGAWTGDEGIFMTGLNRQLDKLDVLSQPDGEIVEVCRDTWHPQYTVVTWGDSAELARNQGIDTLYEAALDGQATPRLAIVLEYFANLMLGNTADPCDAGWAYAYPGEYDRFDNYEVPYNHYINRQARADLPVFKNMVENYWRQDVGADAHFLLWSRLTHGTNVLDAEGSPVPWGRGILADYPARADRWVHTGAWLGWLNDTHYPWLYAYGIDYFYVNDGPPGSGFWAYFPE